MDIFKFKQFDVDQSGCAMKINTDGVLLGALTSADNPLNILDIGTGTGVIALMLAQRFVNAAVDAIEIDNDAAHTAQRNFINSPYRDRIKLHHSDFNNYLQTNPDKKYDLIVSNPPFYINSLEAMGKKMNVAKHTDGRFFEQLIGNIAAHLSPMGTSWLVLPLPTAALVKELVIANGLFLRRTIAIYSFRESAPHREIIMIGKNPLQNNIEIFVIYDAVKFYTKEYQQKLKDFFIVF